jgi:AAA domain
MGMVMTTSNSVLLTGASGAGKSTLLRGALEYYGSGLIVMAPGDDERDSYIGLDSDKYVYGPFDDVLFHAELKEWNASGHSDMVNWLKARYLEIKDDVDNGKKPRYKVLAVDTISAIGRLAYNATLAKFKYTEPPPSISPTGASFYGYLRITLESGIRLMRAIRGLGVHWVVASHPTEADVTPIQALGAAKSKIMPDLPGGLKNVLPSYFTTVLDVGIGTNGKHYVQWAGDPKRVTKSRLGPLSTTGKIELPTSSKQAWIAIATALDQARAKLGEAK